MRFNDNANLYQIRFWDASASTYTARSTTGAADLFPDTFDVGDWIEFTSVDSSSSQTKHFNDIKSLNIDVAIAADSVTGVWEVYSDINGGGYAWRTINAITDNTNGFTSTGNNSVNFDPYDAEFGVAFTGIRYRITAVTNPTEGGHYSAAPQKGDNVIYIENGDSYTPDTLKTWSDTNSYNVVQTFTAYGAKYLNMYRINGILDIESGGTFSLDGQFVELWSNGLGRPLYLIYGDGTLNLGDGSAGGEYNGSALTMGCSAIDYTGGLTSLTVNARNSIFQKPSGINDGAWEFGANATLRNCIIECWRPTFSGGTLDNVVVKDSSWVAISYSSDTTFSGLKTSTAGNGLYTIRQYYTYWATFDGFSGNVYQCRESQWIMLDSPDALSVNWSTKFSVRGEVRIKWRLNVNVVDTNGNPIEDVNVQVVDSQSTTQVDTDTDSNGDITEQNVMSEKHYYISSTYTNTDYNDMDIIISKTGYETITIKGHTFDAPLTLKMVLKTESGGGGVSSAYII